jgi:hypothetical protein
LRLQEDRVLQTADIETADRAPHPNPLPAKSGERGLPLSYFPSPLGCGR